MCGWGLRSHSWADTSGIVGVVYVVIAVVGSVVVKYPGTVLDTEGAFGSAVGAFHAFEVVGVHDDFEVLYGSTEFAGYTVGHGIVLEADFIIISDMVIVDGGPAFKADSERTF